MELDFDGEGARRVVDLEDVVLREEGAEKGAGQLEGCWLRCENESCRKWRLVAKDSLEALRGKGYRREGARRVNAEYESWRRWLEGAAERCEGCLAAHKLQARLRQVEDAMKVILLRVGAVRQVGPPPPSILEKKLSASINRKAGRR